MTYLRDFQVVTLVTDWQKYDAMFRSFVDAGFSEEVARYTPADNTLCNGHEPFSLINRLMGEPGEPNVILCHQDLRLDRGDGVEALRRALAELTQRDARWAVAGNAGCTDDFDFILQVHDPNSFALWDGPLPIEVHSLDENFLVLRRGMGVAASAELQGFHLYGTDVCLNARRRGLGCYVIPFVGTHHSAGNFKGDFQASRAAFEAHWGRQFRFAWVIRSAEFFLSRHKSLRWLGNKGRVKQWVTRSGLIRRFANAELYRLSRRAAGTRA